MQHWKSLIVVLHVLVVLAPEAFSQVSSRISTRFLARGEQALFEINILNDEPRSAPSIPKIPNVEIQSPAGGAQARFLPGRQLAYSYQYLISSYAIGRHTIPSVEINIGGTVTRTEPMEFEVFDPNELEWKEATSNKYSFRYAAGFFTLKDQVYEGETIPTEIKIFIPLEFALSVQDWGVPEFERDGVASWRFEPADMRNRVNLLGRNYVSLAYPSTMSPTRTGTVSIGPAKIRLTNIEVVMEPRPHRQFPETFLEIPKREIQSIPLPSGAPDGFDNAIGQFSLQTSSPQGEIRMGEPISIDVTVTGSGNLDTLRPPRLIDETGWKTYNATANQRGDERRELSGSVVFRQFMRPLELKSMIPPFRLVYFDPNEELYKTVTTDPIPLRMLPSEAATTAILTGPPQALPMPVERMTDILSVLKPSSLLTSPATTIPTWVGHVLGGLLASLLILKALWMHLAPRLRSNPDEREKRQDLSQLTSSPDDATFLRRAGGFIEKWLGSPSSPEIREILNERDTVCFRSDKPTGFLDRKRKQQILGILRKATLACLLLGIAGLAPSLRAESAPTAAVATEDPETALQALPAEDAPPADPQAEEESAPEESSGDLAERALKAYESAFYEDAIALWLQAGPYDRLSSSVLYNIGNACYRLGSPGYAALYYRRALVRNPSHSESLQNLRFLERKLGSITVEHSPFQYALAGIPLSSWKNAAWAGAWITLISLLAFPATRPGAKLRVTAVCLLGVGPLLLSAGALGWYYFPDDAKFAPLERQAVVIADKAVLHSDAARTSPEVIDAPPGSLCEILHTNGRWVYVAFATQTRGWIPASSLETIVPRTPPAPPQIRKPRADGQSA